MKKTLTIIGIIFICILVIIFIVDFFVKFSAENRIINEESLSNLNEIDCILVLGAGIWGDKPSPMLEDRLLEAISLYEKGVAAKIIMSGDHSRIDYDEVNLMKNFAIDRGIPSSDIFMDHAGFSSYESLYRAKEIFEVKKVVIVTQKYHLYRSLYIANQLGIDAYGAGADPRKYQGQFFREAREVLARNKDFIKCIFKPEPTFLGDKIPITGNGDITNDK